MKRASDDVVGRPEVRDFRQDVAGAPIALRSVDVASFRHAVDGPMGTADFDAELMAEFAEFMDGDQDFERAELPDPDPDFRERLRRRLWRAHVLANLREGGEIH